MYEYSDEYDYSIKKSNRNRKIDKRAKSREDFMRVNGAGLKSVILPLLEKKGREAKNRKQK